MRLFVSLRSKQRTCRSIFVAVALELVASLAFGQTGQSFHLSGPAKQISCIVLDETGSRGGVFTQAVDFATRIVGRLPAGAGLIVTSISDRSDREENVLFPLAFLPTNLTSNVARREWIRKLQSLSPRKPKRPISDVVGSVEFVRRLIPDGYKVTIYFFSDLQETSRILSPNDPRLANLHFPSTTHAKAYFVNPGASKTWDALVHDWLKVFHKVGVQIREQDFCPLGNTAACIERDVGRRQAEGAR